MEVLLIEGKEFVYDLDCDCRVRADLSEKRPERRARLSAEWGSWSDGTLACELPAGRPIDLTPTRW